MQANGKLLSSLGEDIQLDFRRGDGVGLGVNVRDATPPLYFKLD